MPYPESRASGTIDLPGLKTREGVRPYGARGAGSSVLMAPRSAPDGVYSQNGVNRKNRRRRRKPPRCRNLSLNREHALGPPLDSTMPSHESVWSRSEPLSEYGSLRKSQRKTLAALDWAVLYRSLWGVSKIGHHLAMAGGTSTQHAITRGDRFLGNGRVHRTVAPGDLISHVLKGIREALMTWDWTDPQDGIHQILSVKWRASPLAWVTVRKDQLKDHMRAHRNRSVKTGREGMASLVSPHSRGRSGIGSHCTLSRVGCLGLRWDHPGQRVDTRSSERRGGWAMERAGKDREWRTLCRTPWIPHDLTPLIDVPEPRAFFRTVRIAGISWVSFVNPAHSGPARGAGIRRGRSPRSWHPFDAKNSG